jgi:hypothetical protein
MRPLVYQNDTMDKMTMDKMTMDKMTIPTTTQTDKIPQ